MGTAANGGSGVVVIRIPCGPGDTAVTPGTNTVSDDGSDKVARFTVTGTLTI
jgi:hypothetical protein